MRGIERWAAALAMMAALAGYGAAEPLVIAERGRPSAYAITVEKDSPGLRHAADELAKYVTALTGVTLPVGTPADGQVVLRSRGVRGDESFRICADGRNLILEGGSDRATFYAVYDFLENDCGCEWLTATQEIVPALARIAVAADYSRSERPAFANRECSWRSAYLNPDFAAKLKLDGFRFYGRHDERHGEPGMGFDPVLMIPHTMHKIMSGNDHFAQHPEWFAETMGRRTPVHSGTRGQYCLANPEVLARTIAFVRERLAQSYPEIKYYSVSQNDSFGYCTCEKCRALDQREGSPAGSVINFVNQVAAAIEKDYPEAVICTLAYMYSIPAPKTLKCRDNVMVCLATDSYDLAKPLKTNRYTDHGRLPQFAENLAAWQRICRHIYIADYAFNFMYYWHAFPYVDAIAANFRFFADHGVKYVHFEGDHSVNARHVESAELKLYLGARLLWNPHQPAKPLMWRFLKGFYGPAAPLAAKYYARLLTLVKDETATPQLMWGTLYSPALTDEFFEWASANWREALKAVKGDARLEENVRWALNCADWTRIMRSGYGAPYECTRHPEYAQAPAVQELRESARRIVADLAADGNLAWAGEEKSVANWSSQRLESLATLVPGRIQASESVRIPGAALEGRRAKVLRLGMVHFDADARYRVRARVKLTKIAEPKPSDPALIFKLEDRPELDSTVTWGELPLTADGWMVLESKRPLALDSTKYLSLDPRYFSQLEVDWIELFFDL